MTHPPPKRDEDDPRLAEIDEILDEVAHAQATVTASGVTPAPAAGDHSGEGCPLGDTWRSWDFLTLTRRELPNRADEDRFNRYGAMGPRVGPIAVTWERGPHDASVQPPTADEGGGVSWRFAKGSPAHAHCEFAIDGHRVHLDRVSGTKYGPGRSWTEFVVFVDGTCVGHAWQGGCALGGGGRRNWPLTVAITRDAGILVSEAGEVTLYRRAPDAHRGARQV